MYTKITYTKLNIAKITMEHYDAFEKLRDNFSTIEKNFGYINRCRARGYSPNSSKEFIKKSCIKMNGEFEIGLLFDILKFCTTNFYDRTITIETDDKIKEYIKQNNFILDDNIIVDESGHKSRDYQLQSMQIALNKCNGIYILGTGAGKTLCCSLLIHNLLKYKLVHKILLICPFPDLANQTFNNISFNLKEHNYKISKWFADIDINLDSDIIIAGANILRSRFEQYKENLMKIDCIIVDECHQLKENNKISSIIHQFPAKYRYGFTGTLPSNKHDCWSLTGKIGPVRYNLPSAELRNDKFLTEVKSLCVSIKLKDIPTYVLTESGVKRPFTYQDEVEWISNNEEFNQIITNIAKKLENNTLILINRLLHAENLLNLCKEQFKDKSVYLIQGDVSMEERSDIKKHLENENNVVVIAQVATFSVGISINNIHNIIFPGLMGKSSIRVVQSIGRILRLKENKNLAKVIDLVPNTKYCSKHYDARKRIYDSEKIKYKEIKLNS